MPAVLHILTNPDDRLAQEIISRQRGLPPDHLEVEVVDLTLPNPDYNALLTRIFAADSIAVW